METREARREGSKGKFGERFEIERTVNFWGLGMIWALAKSCIIGVIIGFSYFLQPT